MKWRQVIALLEQENKARSSVQVQNQKIIQFDKIQKQTITKAKSQTSKASKTSKKDQTIFSFL